MQRYLEARKTDRVAKEVASSRQRAAAAGLGPGGTPPGGVDHRKAESYLEELLLMVQRCEQYNGWMLGRMRDAVAPDPLAQVREVAFR